MVETGHRLNRTLDEHELRSVAQLRMLHALATRLNALADIEAIGEAITSELKTLVDYHNCRIYFVQEDGETLWPVTFRGELTEYASETHDELVTKVGEGITGRAAMLGETYYAPDALRDPHGVQIMGTDEIDESILAVPLKTSDRVLGVIVLSHLGIDQFDDDDQRVLEVLASHAAVAYENARLLEQERTAARTASALLGLSQALSGVRDVSTVFARVVSATPSIIECALASGYLREAESGDFHLLHAYGAGAPQIGDTRPVPAEFGRTFIESLDQPFVIPMAALEQVPREYRVVDDLSDVLVVPLTWEPDEFGAIVVVARPDGSFDDDDISLARGIGQMTSLALRSARRVSELERFHELVETLEAIFWEAEPSTLDFTFLSRGAALVLGTRSETELPERWGDHVASQDRDRVVSALRAALASPGDDLDLEYRAAGRDGGVVWLRDIVHVGEDPRGGKFVRGLIVDVTEGKRAEQALRRSEQKYSEAFHREREATQQLRALDEMKNTFLEAVSHDLRTPLTAILGSAVTLQTNGMEIPREDAVDLLQRIASNARKLQRLLSDLLDLDRLQRGIVTPQRRPTDVGALVRQAAHEFEQMSDRKVELVADELFADVDAAKVERIVENLLANAARHTPPGTRIWARVERQDDGILLVVEDEGDGVPDELKQEIFDAFRQGPSRSSSSPGVGVGLSLVARFAELHGGRAWVEDRPGGGASFRVLLPEDRED